MNKTFEIIELDGKVMLREEFKGNIAYPMPNWLYDKHISSLKVYPISGYIDVVGKTGLVEGKDFQFDFLEDPRGALTEFGYPLIKVATPLFAPNEKSISKSPTSLNWPTDEQIEKMAEDKYPILDKDTFMSTYISKPGPMSETSYSLYKWEYRNKRESFIAGAKAIIAELNSRP